MAMLWHCSPTRERKINRAWHTMTGHYNVYFNGEIKLLEVTQTLEKGHINDFTKIIDVFPYGDEASAKGVTQPLDEVLKKASKSIQDHTVGKYTDDSYLLIAKSHFYKRDYFASIEALQYINSRYKDGGLKPIATTLIAKGYMGMKKPDEAEAIINNCISEFGPKTSKGIEIKPTLKQRLFPLYPKDYYKEMYATAAHINIEQNKYRTAATHMEKALANASKKTDKIRYTYILGQLYLSIDSIKQANEYFTKILGMNAPYEFEFNASINVARAYDPKDKNAVKKVRRSLKRMLKDEKNDGMYDQIHYEMAKLEYKQNNIPEAIKQYKLSILSSTKSKNQKALSYLALGNIYLELPDYKLAQAYYDSTASSISKEYKDYEKIIDKKDLLSELIEYLVEIETQDSLQKIAQLSPEEIEKKIDQWIIAQKADIDRKTKAEQMRKANEKVGASPDMAIGQGLNQNTGTGQWYFYNKTTIVNGQAEFFSMKKWGRRINEDYWRLSQKEKAPINQPVTPDGKVTAEKMTFEDAVETNKTADKKDSAAQAVANRKEWIKNVPFAESDLKKSNEKIVDSYYGIGVLYNEKLLDFKEAIKNFDIMLERFPANIYEPEVLYREYKMYISLKDEAKANFIKATLITRYPNSPYSLLLQNKPLATPDDSSNKEIVLLYEQTYASFQNGNYNEVFTQVKKAKTEFQGNAMMAKFDLINALAIGKTQPKENFTNELELLKKDYPNTDVSEYASNILNVINRPVDTVSTKPIVKDSAAFEIEENAPHYYVFATKVDKFDNNEALTVFNRYSEEYMTTDKLRVNNLLTNDGYQLVYVVQFANLNNGMKYIAEIEKIDLIKNQMKFNGSYVHFIISVTNFRKMLKNQKTDAYNTFFQEKRKTLTPIRK